MSNVSICASIGVFEVAMDKTMNRLSTKRRIVQKQTDHIYFPKKVTEIYTNINIVKRKEKILDKKK
jgi:hypothetical protein